MHKNFDIQPKKNYYILIYDQILFYTSFNSEENHTFSCIPLIASLYRLERTEDIRTDNKCKQKHMLGLKNYLVHIHELTKNRP